MLRGAHLLCAPQYERALSKHQDVDKVEVEVDGIMQKLLAQLFGAERIASQVSRVRSVGAAGRGTGLRDAHASAGTRADSCPPSHLLAGRVHCSPPPPLCSLHTHTHSQDANAGPGRGPAPPPTQTIPQEALQAELDSLEDGVNETGGQGVAGAVFSLALNALERLHQDALTSLMGLEEDEEEAKEGGAALEEVRLGRRGSGVEPKGLAEDREEGRVTRGTATGSGRWSGTVCLCCWCGACRRTRTTPFSCRCPRPRSRWRTRRSSACWRSPSASRWTTAPAPTNPSCSSVSEASKQRHDPRTHSNAQSREPWLLHLRHGARADEAGNTPRAGEIPSGAAAATFDASRDAAEPSPSSESAPLAGAISVVPPLLTEADFEPVPEAEARTSRHHQGASTKASSLAGTGAALPSPAQQQAGASSTSATVATTPNGSGALSPGKQTMQLPGAAAVADAAKPLSGLAATVAAVAATAANGAPAASASQVLSASSFGDPDNPRYSDSANPASKLQAPAQVRSSARRRGCCYARRTKRAEATLITACAGTQAAQEGQPAGQTGQPGDEQHRQFVNFLQVRRTSCRNAPRCVQLTTKRLPPYANACPPPPLRPPTQSHNPQACMFHAQMRLSLEGCRKLANFLTNSSRVRALSLSHNFLGEPHTAPSLLRPCPKPFPAPLPLRHAGADGADAVLHTRCAMLQATTAWPSCARASPPTRA